MLNNKSRDIPGGPGVRLRALNAGVPGSIPGRGSRSCMHVATVRTLKLKILHAATKTRGNIHTYIYTYIDTYIHT